MIFKPRNYIIGFVVFALIITTGLSLFSMIGAKNPSFLKDSDNSDDTYTQLQNNFNKTAQVQAYVTNLKSQVDNSNLPDPAKWVSLGFVYVFSGLASAFSSMTVMEGIISATATVFGIFVPTYVPTFILAIISILFVFTLISATLYREL